MKTMQENLIVNIKLGHRGDVYVGRRCGKWPRSDWHNPFMPKDESPEALAECLKEFNIYLLSEKTLMKRLPELEGRVLLCWCAPEEGLTIYDPLICHGQVLGRAVLGEKIRRMRELGTLVEYNPCLSPWQLVEKINLLDVGSAIWEYLESDPCEALLTGGEEQLKIQN